jgi:hypothetical protein
MRGLTVRLTARVYALATFPFFFLFLLRRNVCVWATWEAVTDAEGEQGSFSRVHGAALEDIERALP